MAAGGYAGSGTVVEIEGNQALILTAKHVVRTPGIPATVRTYYGVTYAGRVLAVDDRADLAAVVVQTTLQNGISGLSKAPVAGPGEDDITQPGSEVVMVGYGGDPNGRYNTKWGQYISQLNDTDYRFSFAPVSGDSGGGVFRRSDGKLISVVVARPAVGPQYGICVGRQPVCRFLRGLNWCKPRPSAPPAGPPASPVPPVTSPPTQELAPILAKLDELQKQVAELQARKPEAGPPGPPGRDGKNGVDGKDGLAGPAGRDAPAVRVRIERIKPTQ